MTSFGSRHDAERALAKALSRHIGYTSGAYDLGRIVSVVTVFSERPSAYKSEIVDFLRRQGSSDDSEANSEAYLSEVPNFTQALGLIETVSSREAKLQRCAPTELGRSLLGAMGSSDQRFYRYFLSRIVTTANADSLVPILNYFQLSERGVLAEHYLTFQVNLRKLRWEWLCSTFPDRSLRDRIASQITWLSRPRARGGEYSIEIPTQNTARHHATPILGWLEELELADRAHQELTQLGRDILETFWKEGSYFWLGPPKWALEVLQVKETAYSLGPLEDAFNFKSLPRVATADEIGQLVCDVSKMMIDVFQDAKLVHAPQASLRLPIEYITYRAYYDNCAYDWESILQRAFTARKGVLERLSAHRGQIGFYRCRAQVS